jgi:hypothetical protein
MVPRWFAAALLGAALMAGGTPAHADGGDVIHVGRTIHINHGEEVDNAVCFFCSVEVDGTVTGDVVSFLGNVRIAGDVQHDAVVVLGGLTAEKGSSIEQDVIAVLGEARLGENVIVGRDVVTFSGEVEMAPTATVGNQRIDNPGWYIWIPLACVLLILLWVMRSYGAYRKRLVARGYKFHAEEDDE